VASTCSDKEVVKAAEAEAGRLGMGSHVTKTEQFTMTQLQADHCAVKKSVCIHKRQSIELEMCNVLLQHAVDHLINDLPNILTTTSV
jgi:hypothetical protein